MRGSLIFIYLLCRVWSNVLGPMRKLFKFYGFLDLLFEVGGLTTGAVFSGLSSLKLSTILLVLSNDSCTDLRSFSKTSPSSFVTMSLHKTSIDIREIIPKYSWASDLDRK